MDVKLIMTTVYANDGKRIGLRLHDDVEAAFKLGKSMAEDFGTGCSFKVWECFELKEGSKK